MSARWNHWIHARVGLPRWILAPALLIGWLTASCTPLESAFRCEESAQCVEGAAQGVCEPNGFCSFPDSACPAGRRWAAHAGDLSSACIEGPQNGDGGSGGTGDPANLEAPAIAGGFVDGARLTANPGRWQSAYALTFHAQWRRCDAAGAGCADIAGAVGLEYTATPADVGSALRVVVAASSPIETAAATSAPTPAIAPLAPANVEPPRLAGRADEGHALTALPGRWSGTPPIALAYQWQRCDAAGEGCQELSGATAASVTPGPAEVGAALRVRVTASNGGGSQQAQSEPSAPIRARPRAATLDAPAIAIALQPDGKRVIGGSFQRCDAVFLPGLARLAEDGALDPGLGPEGAGLVGGAVTAAAFDSRGRLLVGGYFSAYGGLAVGGLVRLLPNGARDSTFAPPRMFGVTTLAVDSVGRILVGDEGGGLRRLADDGAVDPTFQGADRRCDSVIRALALDAEGRILVAGNFATCSGSPRGRLARFAADGTLDPGFVPPDGGFDNPVEELVVDAQGRITVGGIFAHYGLSAARGLARLRPDASLETAFDLGLVFALALEPSGNLLVGGGFGWYQGQEARSLIRLASDGALLTRFAKSLAEDFDDNILALAVDGAGRVVVGGDFAAIGSVPAAHLARFSADGVLEPGFGQAEGGLSGPVRALAVDPRGRAVAAGSFAGAGGVRCPRVARLQADDAHDPSFVAEGIGPNGVVRALAVDGSGAVTVGGDFTQVGETPTSYLARLRTDGALDSAFQQAGTGLNGSVSGLAVDGSGRVVAGGNFTAYDGTALGRLARFSSDGRLDPTFGTGAGLDGYVRALAIDGSGRIVVGGSFTTYDGASHPNLVRVLSNGSLDATFPRGGAPASTVESLAIDSQGRVLVGGSFTNFGASPVNRVVRLLDDGSLDPTFAPPSAYFWIAYALGLGPSGSVFVGGSQSPYLAELGAGGTATSWSPGVDGAVRGIAVAPDGRVLAVGDFLTAAGAPARYFGSF